MAQSTTDSTEKRPREKQRLFLAVPASDEVINPVLESLEASLEQLPPLVAVPRKNLHMTLIFLGNQGTDSTDKELIPLIEETLAECHPGRIHFRQVAGFPHTRSPRHLVLEGVASASAQGLQNNLREALNRFLPEENGKDKHWRPHITLARFQEKQPRPIEPVPWQSEFPFNELVLYRSETTMHGPVYHELRRWSLSDSE